MPPVRNPAVAGLFYPEDPTALREVVQAMLQAAAARPRPGNARPVALIAPHAGYVYSGPIAASAYTLLQNAHDIERVILIGPSHRVPVDGMALPGAQAFRTPLGDVPLHEPSIRKLLRLPNVTVNAASHRQEHSLEVHLPFLQEVLGRFELVPLVTGRIDAESACEILRCLEPDDATLIVVSSDLSHYHDYDTARALDSAASRAIVDLAGDELGRENACGRHGIRGLLQYARSAGWQAHLLDLRNSGDTAGDRQRVVGYGAYSFDRA